MDNLLKELFEERWKPIVIDGKKTDYMVSNMAKVKRKGGETFLKHTLNRTKYNKNERVDYSVSLQLDGQWKQFKVHRLVAQAFIPNPKKFSDVLRRKGKSNSADNLYWAPRSDTTKGSKQKKGKEHWKFGQKVAPETRKLMSDSKKGRNHYRFKGLYICEGLEFESANQAALHFKISPSTVIKRVKNKDFKDWKFEAE